ncbi:putative orphan protein [Halorhodospira halochloris]|uniref:Orphan protein n=1 Tax=Halorhodospira halochloris TaxID=1052 RepID=A0A120MZJ4_HALHR|nr:putative orphan protein [Halorhodospira halochloris]
MQARQQLAAQMGIQIQSMAEQYERTIETDGEITTGAHFEEVTRGVIEQELRGSVRIKGDYVTMPNGNSEFCSMMAIGQSSVNAILDEVASAAGADKEVFTQGEMREQFMSQEALNRMDRQLGN